MSRDASAGQVPDPAPGQVPHAVGGQVPDPVPGKVSDAASGHRAATPASGKQVAPTGRATEGPAGVPAEQFPGTPDGYDRLWTPHRMAYIDGEAKPTSDDAGPGCPFCVAPQLRDEPALIVHRGQTCFVVLNLFPYNPGHLLICPYRHVADLTDLTVQERHESTDLSARAMEVLRATKSPHGFNLGMNAGHSAGAGVAAHAHQHVVPRWEGDANFLPIIGRTKAVPELLDDTRTTLAAAWGS